MTMKEFEPMVEEWLAKMLIMPYKFYAFSAAFSQAS
jgi:hypothetical protein